MPEHDDNLGDDYAPDDDDSMDDECGLTDGGQCMLAGTEHCDFECPWRDSERFAGSRAWIEKHSRMGKP